MIRIVTDSAAQALPAWASANQVTVLPHRVTVNGKTYREGVDVSEAELSAHIATARGPITIEPPSVDEFTEAYRVLADQKIDIVSLHVSSALSGATRNAAVAQAGFRGRCNIQVIDSRCVSLGLNALVQSTQQLIDSALDIDEVVRQVRGLIPRVYGVFISEDLKFLENSKRLRPAQADLGKMLNIVPCLSLEDGDIVAVEKVRTSERAVEKLAEFAGEFDDFERMAILQLNSVPHAHSKALILAIRELFPRLASIPVQNCGAIVGSIIGPSGCGVMIFEGSKGVF